MGSISAATSNTATSYYDDPDVSTVVGHEFTVTCYAFEFFKELTLEKADIKYDQNAMELLNIKIEKINNTVLPWYKRILSIDRPNVKIYLKFKALNATGGYKITISTENMVSIEKVVNICPNRI